MKHQAFAFYKSELADRSGNEHFVPPAGQTEEQKHVRRHQDIAPKNRSANETGTAAALQYVRKVSGFRAPSAKNQPVFDEAVERIAAATAELMAELQLPEGAHTHACCDRIGSVAVLAKKTLDQSGRFRQGNALALQARSRLAFPSTFENCQPKRANPSVNNCQKSRRRGLTSKDLLYADDRWSLLVVFRQWMPQAGQHDQTRHVMESIRRVVPVTSFKTKAKRGGT